LAGEAADEKMVVRNITGRDFGDVFRYMSIAPETSSVHF
jgi:hypothetical protein